MNLHYETVSPLLKETLQKLVNSPIFKDFTLIGGTCLSLQLGHRRSIDIDLFTDIDYGTMNTKDMNITFYSFHFADEKNFTILSYRGLI